MFDPEYLFDLKNSRNGKRTVIEQGESLIIEGTLLDGDDNAISKVNIVTLTMSLFDEDTSTVINSRNGVDILDANDGTVTAAGVFTIRLGASDAAIVNSSKEVNDLETHVIRITWTWNDGVATNTGISEYRIYVKKTATLS